MGMQYKPPASVITGFLMDMVVHCQGRIDTMRILFGSSDTDARFTKAADLTVHALLYGLKLPIDHRLDLPRQKANP
jgi:hypothetical protein